MNTLTKKYIHQLKAGDLVRAHGGIFQVTQDARESQSHRPTYWAGGGAAGEGRGHVTLPGPCSCAYAPAVCLEGTIPGYFKPGSSWDFQGNFLAGKYSVIDQEAK
jgi:hypothetical protein